MFTEPRFSTSEGSADAPLLVRERLDNATRKSDPLGVDVSAVPCGVEERSIRKRVRALFARALEHVVADCPPELEACQDCHETSCPQVKWETCQLLLDAIARSQR